MPDYAGTRGPLPPVYFLASLFIAIGLHYRAPVAVIISQPWNLAGIFVIVAGVGIVIHPALAFRTADTSIIPFRESSSLVREGMYRFSRNPMYLGMLTVLLGACAVLGSLSPFVVPFLFYLIIRHRFIRVEESMLEEKFGDEYLEFKRSVRRWI
jgi:protein-S-isoprenylcysteine O-methyltransferase Ste14